MRRILINKYEVLEPVSAGGMGVVYKALDLHLNRIVALKETREADGPAQKEAVRTETELLKRLKHPMLPEIYDYFEENSKACIVMEYVEGITLEQYIKKSGKIEADQAVKWAVSMTEVLSYLHNRHPSVIYRDLKPGNIMVTPDGEIKLIDFGTALKLEFGNRKGYLYMGTPGYGAPEQFKSEKVGCRADIFGVGAILHEMLTGVSPLKPPFIRRSIREYDYTFPAGLERLVRICTAERQEERYSSMEQLKKELLRYDGISIKSRVWLFIRKTAGLFLWLFFIMSAILPLIFGIPADQIPFPYLVRPVIFLILAAVLQLTINKKYNTKKDYKKIEKSIWLSEKNFIGLFMLILTLITCLNITVLMMQIEIPLSAKYKEQELYVEMRDDQGRKMLLKDEAVYCTGKSIRMELPADKAPREEISLRLTAHGESGILYGSRIFLLKCVQDNG